MRNWIKNFWPFNKYKDTWTPLSIHGGIYQAECGHSTRLKDQVTAFGGTTCTEIKFNGGNPKYCHKCLEKMAIKCAWCERPIFIGDMITLYSPNKLGFKVPEGSVVYKQEPLTLVGCQRSDCAETGADYCGHWLPPGKVERFQSGIELIRANPGHAIIGKPREYKLLKTNRN